MCCVLFVLKCVLCVELMWCVAQILCTQQFESECRCIRRKQGRHTEQLRQWEIQFYRIIIDGLNSFYRMRSRVQDTATPVLKRAWRRHIHCWSMWCRTSSDEPAPIKLLIRIEWVFLLRFFALTLSAVGHIWVASDLQCSAECVFVCDLCVCVTQSFVKNTIEHWASWCRSRWNSAFTHSGPNKLPEPECDKTSGELDRAASAGNYRVFQIGG